MGEIYLVPDENGIWHKTEIIEWEPGKENEALNKAFEMGQREANKRLEPLIKEIHDKVYAEGMAKGREKTVNAFLLKIKTRKLYLEEWQLNEIKNIADEIVKE